MTEQFFNNGLGMGIMLCPGCGGKIAVSSPGDILVNADIERTFMVEGMWIPDERCNNPLCKWSEIE